MKLFQWVVFSLVLIDSSCTFAHEQVITSLFGDIASLSFEQLPDGTDSNVFVVASLQDFKSEIIEGSQPVVVLVYAHNSPQGGQVNRAYRAAAHNAAQSFPVRFAAIDVGATQTQELLSKLINIFTQIVFGGESAASIERLHDLTLLKTMIDIAQKMPLQNAKEEQIKKRLLMVLKLLVIAFESPERALPVVMFFKQGKFILPNAAQYLTQEALQQDIVVQLLESKAAPAATRVPVVQKDSSWWDQLKKQMSGIKNSMFGMRRFKQKERA